MTTLQIKVNHQGDVRRLSLSQETLSMEVLRSTILSTFAMDISVPVICKYKDEDGDLVTLSSPQDLQEALLLIASSTIQPPLRITINLDCPPPTPHHRVPGPQPDHWEDPNQMDDTGDEMDDCASREQLLSAISSEIDPAKLSELGLGHFTTEEFVQIVSALRIRPRKLVKLGIVPKGTFRKLGLNPHQNGKGKGLWGHGKGMWCHGKGKGMWGHGKGKGGGKGKGNGKGGKGKGAGWFCGDFNNGLVSPADESFPSEPDAKKRQMARMVSHVTIPNGTVLQPGQHFTKTWRLRNDSTAPWPESVELALVGGNGADMQTTATPILRGGVLPGGEADVTVELVAPSQPGQYEGFWRLRMHDEGTIQPGFKFGQRLKCEILVKGGLSSGEDEYVSVEPEPANLELLMRQMQDMGFTNTDVNKALLIKYNGNVERATNRLLSEVPDIAEGKRAD